ncbi:bifunctional riboflavin kinase/FAD synthetase [Tenuibacillus multivorans]|uniref:Riboflavin biosynthesis protein n=1 Tax=Tenuibacillus multivorans TaxID=237069 RepID=A0A1G9XV44_9BACI|nr:bifunctional riboflavin kinase/FAD synthetase [Tenuibacillus multivorans]GEL75831.1 riboflavin biosynthesis protein [Tenuibacillus multivorans]SDN00709.1 riboflavin kinase / FMN adenylyltransferase [Tenuibacillus multivorans]
MQIFELTYPNHLVKDIEETSMAVGYFDGVHKGHQQVIQTAIDVANDRGFKSAVMTFHPHPLSVLKQTQLEDFLITSLEEKKKYLESMNVDYMFIVTFNKELAQLSPEDFVQKFFIEQNVQHVVGGYDFSFGHKGAGKIQNMKQYAGEQLTYSVVDKVTYKQEKVSSTRIRETLDQGDMTLVENLLGHPYLISAEVVKGEQRGRTIGYPTANLAVPLEHKLPKVGVYAVQALVNNKYYYGMANVGYNPTFTDDVPRPLVEVNLFDFNEDIYGIMIDVEFRYYVRDEEKFDNAEQLISRMKEDEVETKNFFQIQT